MLIRLAGRLMIAVLSAGLGFLPASASFIIVPDGVPTVQSAIDSGVDTVLIREGSYAERPSVDRAVALLGIGAGRRPKLAGLRIYNSNFWAAPALLDVRHIDFAGRINYSTIQVHPRGLTLSFFQCAMDSGIQVINQDTEDVAVLSIYNCRMAGGSGGQIDRLYMVADTVDGGVAWRVRRPSIADCWFRGGPGRAIEMTGSPVLGPVTRNRIENYGTGIYGEELELFRVDGNTIRNCGTGISVVRSSEVTVSGNEILGCGAGVGAGSCEALRVSSNKIIGAITAGVGLSDLRNITGLVVEDNIIGGCGGAGIAMESPEDATIRGNSVFANGGTGIVVAMRYGSPTYGVRVENNISVRNGGWGLWAGYGYNVVLACNDWFGNALGAVSGTVAGASDFSVDPMFCNLDSADVRLDSSSPLVDAAGCGQIGALGMGCGVTATLLQRFAAVRMNEVVRVVWQVASGATASEIWLERSEGGDGRGWIRPVTERSFEGEAVIELDRSAASDHAYWYRLVALEGSDAVVIGAPIVVQAGLSPGFRLVEAGPNPGGGPVRIAFALKHTAPITIDVYDVQGRRVASPGRGPWPAGTHAVEWNGRTHQGETAPAGLYFLRYQYPGGQDRRAIIRTR